MNYSLPLLRAYLGNDFVYVFRSDRATKPQRGFIIEPAFWCKQRHVANVNFVLRECWRSYMFTPGPTLDIAEYCWAHHVELMKGCGRKPKPPTQQLIAELPERIFFSRRFPRVPKWAAWRRDSRDSHDACVMTSWQNTKKQETTPSVTISRPCGRD